jgi:hypothetical protein
MNIYKIAFGALLIVVGTFGSCFVLFGNDGLPVWENVFFLILFEGVAAGVGAPLLNEP